MRRLFLLVASFGVAATTSAAGLEVEIEIPRLAVAEYHKPYVAVWIANPDQSVAANLGVWYQQTDGPEGEGTTWLKDLRQWWRRSGRSLDLPVDGTTAPTRGPGSHTLSFNVESAQIASLAEGDYTLYVEAVREVGGREILQLPFRWSGEAQTLSVAGERELGAVKLTLNP